jgi:hypothetical protein
MFPMIPAEMAGNVVQVAVFFVTVVGMLFSYLLMGRA